MITIYGVVVHNATDDGAISDVAPNPDIWSHPRKREIANFTNKSENSHAMIFLKASIAFNIY